MRKLKLSEYGFVKDTITVNLPFDLANDIAESLGVDGDLVTKIVITPGKAVVTAVMPADDADVSGGAL